MIINLIITLLTIKNCPCSNAIDAESKPKFCSSSSAIVAIVASPYVRNILDRDEKDLNVAKCGQAGRKTTAKQTFGTGRTLSILLEC